jgi:predicted DNA-binding ribbon-helix-helix protein
LCTFGFMSQTKDTKTEARGLRLEGSLWSDLEELAGNDRRKLNQYISLVLTDHVIAKKIKNSDKITIKKNGK